MVASLVFRLLNQSKRKWEIIDKYRSLLWTLLGYILLLSLWLRLLVLVMKIISLISKVKSQALIFKSHIDETINRVGPHLHQIIYVWYWHASSIHTLPRKVRKCPLKNIHPIFSFNIKHFLIWSNQNFLLLLFLWDKQIIKIKQIINFSD